MVGRQPELDDLRAWLCTEPPISIRVLTGNAGYGKTRLALELIEEIVPQGWYAGFVTREELKRFREQPGLAGWGWNAPVLAVVDYASACARDLHAWVKELEDNPVWNSAESRNGFPLRLLLLERQAEPGVGWWAEVFGIGGEAAVLEKLADPSEPVALRSLDDVNQRRAILTKTLARLDSTVTLPALGQDLDFDRRLAELTWAGVPLLLMLAAATAAREGFGAVLAMGSSDLAFNVAETELARILKVVESKNVSAALAPLVRHVAAVATLRQGLTPEAAREVIERESEELGYQLPYGSAALRDAFAVALPDDAGGIAPVQPDMIGEALLLDVWQEDNIEALPAIARAHAADPEAVAKTVIRTCQDYIIRGHRHPLNWMEKIRVDSADSYALMRLSDAMPRSTLELREIAAELAKAVADQAKPQAGDVLDLEQLEILSAALNNLSIRLSELGRREEALAAIEMAVALHRAFTTVIPGAFSPDLAGSLNNLSTSLSALGRREEALAAIEEAVTICRDLATADPDAFRPNLAASLTNLSKQFSALGRWDESLAAIEEAIESHRHLADAHPDAFRPDLAQSINNLSTYLSALGRREEALAAIEEAVAIWRDLAAAGPDAFRPNLVGYLNNLSTYLSDLGRQEEALAAIEEAVGICRDLVDARPDVFRPNLAGVLISLSNSFSGLARWKEALAAIEEAVGIFRDLADAHPDVFRPDLAASLNNLSGRSSMLGHWEKAFAASEEVVDLYRDLADTHPDAFRHHLAESLNNLSSSFSGLGQREEALAAIEEAVGICRDLADAHPDTFRPDLATTLANLSRRFSDLSRREEALAAIEEAVATLREPFLAQPMAFMQQMVVIISDYLERCKDTGRQESDPALGTPIFEILQYLKDQSVE